MTRVTAIAMTAAVTLGAAGCGLFGPADEWADRQAALDTSRDRWEDAGITSYTYTLRRQCYSCGGGDLLVTVEDRVVVEVARPGDEGPLPTEVNEHVETVEDLFDKIQEAIDERAFRFRVEYDAELGYPTVVDLDPIREAIDEEIRYDVTGLEPTTAG